MADNARLPFDPWTRHSSFEYEKYAPDEARRKKIYYWLVLPIWIAGAVVLFTISNQALRSDQYLGFIIVVGVWSALCQIPYYVLGHAANEAVARARYETERRQEAMITRIAHDVAQLTNKGRIMFGSAIVKDSPGAKISISISGSFNQEITPDARRTFDQIDNTDHGLADDIARITALLEQSNNKDAWQSWMDFLEEAGKEKKPSKLKAYWEQVVKFVPDVVSLADSVAKLVSVFMG